MSIDPLIDFKEPDSLRLEIPFTQYLLPDGRTRPMRVPVVGDIAEKADKILKHGWRFEAEILTTGQVSLTVFDGEEDENVAIEIIKNGPLVTKAVDRLVEAAFELIAKESE